MARKTKDPGFVDWVEPAYLNLSWQPGGIYNRLPEPWQEITQDEWLKLVACEPECLAGVNFNQVYLPAVFDDHEGDVNRQGMWSVKYSFYPSYAVAVASRYQRGPAGQAFVSDKPDGGNYGHALRFFRIGCQHPNLQSGWVAMHDLHANCPDCEYSGSFDTSG